MARKEKEGDLMGRDLTLYPESASKKELKDYIKSLGFLKCDHLWPWPNGTLNFMWFDNSDFKSIDGVSADIYPVTEKENKYTNNKWALHVRNSYSASLDDVKMLNKVLRDARKRFGGTISGDYGTNKYAPLWRDESTPISRGINMIYENVMNNMDMVEYALPNAMINQNNNEEENSDDKLINYMNAFDPARVIYNGLIPFAVSMFEFFFSQVFQVLIKYDNYAIEKRDSFKQKYEFNYLVEVEKKERTIESLIAMNYTFQNLNQLNKAYKEWLNIDVRKILYQKRKIGKSITYLENRIDAIIQYRHGIIHHFMIDRGLTKEDYTDVLKTIKLSIDEVVNYLERKYEMKIEDHRR